MSDFEENENEIFTQKYDSGSYDSPSPRSSPSSSEDFRFRRSPTPMRKEDEAAKSVEMPIGTMLVVLLAVVVALNSRQLPRLPNYNITEVANFMSPLQIWPFVAFTGMLVLTLDMDYFPTALSLITHTALMIHLYEPTTRQLVYCIAAYLLGAAIWCLVKFWSFLRESKQVDEIRGINPGSEGSYIRKHAGYLYRHVTYWPLSVPYTIWTRIIYQFYMNLGSGMVARRREQLQKL